MNMIKSFLRKNDCYKANKKLQLKGLMLHSVGCSQPSATVFINAWNKPKVYKCVHAFIEASGDVYQTLDWNVRGWHGGKKYSNDHYIGVEMCEPNTIKYEGDKIIILDYDKTKSHIYSTYTYAVELFAKLCIEFDLNPLNDIISHKEGCEKGIASNHGDPNHLWDLFGLSMDKFRNDVDMKVKNAFKSTFVVRVITNNLNVRKTPKIENNNVICQIHKGEAYTIVETQNGWGKLKSGIGWIRISDKYCEVLPT